MKKENIPESGGYVYILKGENTLYIGSTENLEKRIWEHKEKLIEDSFRNRYNVTNLVYFEKFAELYESRDREYQLKKWTRKKKNFLIEKVNESYVDLAKDWFEE